MPDEGLLSLPTTVCPDCGSTEFVMKNYFAGDGDVHCAKCGRYIRMWNAS